MYDCHFGIKDLMTLDQGVQTFSKCVFGPDQFIFVGRYNPLKSTDLVLSLSVKTNSVDEHVGAVLSLSHVT